MLSLGLLNPKSPDNVGSVMRAAGNFGVDAVYYTGTRYPRALSLKPGAANTRRSKSDDIPLALVNSLIDPVPQNTQIICVELVEDGIALPEYQHPENALYIFGPEDGNISQTIIDRADEVVYIPTQGCMNLAATVSVLLYDRLAKSAQLVGNNALIRQSRDRNNNLKVRSR